jgi:hypothetical protein
MSVASAAPNVLVDDPFEAPDDSLWHFQTAAFTDGVLSPGLAADPRGHSSATGQLRVDASASALRFMPRHGTKAHRSCFLGYRSDFRIDGVSASKVEVEIRGEIANPAADDSLGGLYILVRYEDEYGNSTFARTTTDIRFPQTVAIDTARLVPVRKLDWYSSPPLEGAKLGRARSRIIGLGLCYISQNAAAFRSQSLLVGGFKAKGDLVFPPLPGNPEAAEILAGDTVALTWDFPRALSAEFQWYRNEKPISSELGARYVFRPGPDEARIHDFRAEVRLPSGDRISTRTIRVRVVRPAPPAIGPQSGDTTVPLGGNVVLRIAASGLQPLAYQWHRNDKPIPGAKGPVFTFVPTAVTEGGRYYCEVKDRQGRSGRSRPVTLIVRPGPDEEAGLPSGLSLGPKAGINVSDFYRDPSGPARSDSKLNFLQAGIGADWRLSPVWALQADLLYSRKGVNYAFDDHTSVYDLDYVELPLMVRARIGKWIPKAPLSLVAGGYGAYLVGADRLDDWDTWKGNESLDGFASFDYGAVLGLSWQFGDFSVESRYTLGLAPLEAGGAGEGRMNGAFSAMVGFTLFTPLEGPR